VNLNSTCKFLNQCALVRICDSIDSVRDQSTLPVPERTYRCGSCDDGRRFLNSGVFSNIEDSQPDVRLGKRFKMSIEPPGPISVVYNADASHGSSRSYLSGERCKFCDEDEQRLWLATAVEEDEISPPEQAGRILFLPGLPRESLAGGPLIRLNIRHWDLSDIGVEAVHPSPTPPKYRFTLRSLNLAPSALT
jgi:hypothetical protein